MALPLPRVIPDVGPGGGIVTAMGGINALNDAMILKKINEIKSQYLPTTLQAEAASKLAYANLMGPQFLAKLLQNPGAIANMGDKAAQEALLRAAQAGMGQGSGLNYLNNIPQHTGIGQPSTNSFSGRIKNAFHALVGQNQAPIQAQNPFANTAPMNNTPPPAATPSTNSDGGDVPTYATESGSNPIAEQAYDLWLKSPEGQAELRKGEAANFPDEKEVVAWAQNKRLGKPSVNMDMRGGTRPASAPSYAENTGRYQGIVKEGEELGKVRAKAIDELDNQYQQAVQSEVPLKHMNEIVTNPTFQKMRQFPWFQNLQLGAKAKIGSPEEQQLVGDFQTTALKAVAETVMGFKGRILDKEVSLANDMKVSKNDTLNVILGKLPTIEAFNEMTKQRSRIASQLMAQKHISRGDALEQADKMVDGNAIRKKIEMELSPEPTEEDFEHTAKTHNMTVEEVKKKYRSMRAK